MKIPVFVSCSTKLNNKQEASREIIIEKLESLNLEARTLGRTDYPRDYPLREVLVLGQHCSGGIILGFSQFEASSGKLKKDTDEEREIKNPMLFPTPWNQLEAGILFGLGLPLLIFREIGLEGGIFDLGATDVFVHHMPSSPLTKQKDEELREVFLSWHALVRTHYYGEPFKKR